MVLGWVSAAPQHHLALPVWYYGEGERKLGICCEGWCVPIGGEGWCVPTGGIWCANRNDQKISWFLVKMTTYTHMIMRNGSPSCDSNYLSTHIYVCFALRTPNYFGVAIANTHSAIYETLWFVINWAPFGVNCWEWVKDIELGMG